ncbi:hypothetical protein SAY87_008788 [Trapa incisa]|uniref:Uncharacterized protein n=1 Tax=Trapa incisa TaxID=236973 RepID=A0AAN7JVN2_9MYRT|nr:hypothetical protein SAY87_008788 [Trapa incisa]
MIDLLPAKELVSMDLAFLPSHPLFSTILTLYILVLLYSPPFFLTVLLSPVPALTVILLLTLLRLGTAQDPTIDTPQEEPRLREEDDPGEPSLDWPDNELPFVYWDVKAPLEVIYEEADEEAGDLDQCDRLERWPSLSLFFPESDTDSDSDCSSVGEFPSVGDSWVSPEEENGFGWIDSERDGLIEIQLDLDLHGGVEKKERCWDFHGEEDNLIEIDISPARNGKLLAEKMVDSRREGPLVALR